MDFKRRLLMAFFIIVTVPVILVVATGKMMIDYQVSSIQDTYNEEYDSLQIIANPLQLLSRVTSSIYERVKGYAVNMPQAFEDMHTLNGINTELKGNYSFLAVRRGNEFVYVGDKIRLEEIKDKLPSFQYRALGDDGWIYINGATPVLIKQLDFHYVNGNQGSVFIVTDVETIVPQLKVSVVQAVISFVGIIILTAVVLVAWLYRSIVRPLNVLKVATGKMKEGNLNFSISGDPEDELGQLCEDFEEMRVHLKELLEVQMQYERDTTELISNISHDLKTPLTAIKGYAEGIMDGVADTPEKQEKYMKTIYNKANDISVLVDELAFYSKIDCNTIPYNYKVLSVDAYFDDCIDELSLDLEVKSIELNYDNLHDGSIRTMADPEQMKRVINNIIGNSVKYLDKANGRICVRLKVLGKCIQIEIEDNGAGISPKDLPNIFDRFYRADASRNSKQGGSGLGLAIAKKIIEDHSGQIWATSEALVGTSVYFTLPIWMPEDTPAAEPSGSRRGIRRQTKDKKDKNKGGNFDGKDSEGKDSDH